MSVPPASCLVSRRCPGLDRLRLLAPEVRYADGHAAPASAGSASAWRSDAMGDQAWDDGRIRLSVRSELEDADGVRAVLVVRLAVREQVQLGICALNFAAPCDAQPQMLDRFLRWRPLVQAADLNDFSPLLLWLPSGDAVTEIRNERGFVACSVLWDRRQVRLRLVLDAAALHPRWQFTAAGPRATAAPAWEPGQTAEIRLRIRECARPGLIPVAPGRWPAGAEACFTLTDHCDFDTVETLAAFLEGDGWQPGWLGRGLRMSKGAFALKTPPPRRPPAAALPDAAYRALLARLRADGSEIVPHGVNEYGNVGPEQFHEALRDFAGAWRPRTWIDHGNTLQYCYTMGGADDPRYRLLQALAEQGIATLWAYHDAPCNPAQSLNLLAPEAPSLRSWLAVVRGHLRRGRGLVAAHYVRSAVYWKLEGPAGAVLKAVLSAARSLLMSARQRRRPRAEDVARQCQSIGNALRRLFRRDSGGPGLPYDRGELLAFGAVLYPERGRPLHQCGGDEPVLFVTQETLHLRDTYAEGALDRLMAERGLHIGHTYLLNRLPYLHGLFLPGGPPRLAPEWCAFLDALSNRVGAGPVWNPVMSDLADWMRQSSQVACIPRDDHTFELHHYGTRDLPAFTLLLPQTLAPERVTWNGRPPSGWRVWKDWLAVWGPVPAGRSVPVAWG